MSYDLYEINPQDFNGYTLTKYFINGKEQVFRRLDVSRMVRQCVSFAFNNSDEKTQLAIIYNKIPSNLRVLIKQYNGGCDRLVNNAFYIVMTYDDLAFALQYIKDFCDFCNVKVDLKFEASLFNRKEKTAFRLSQETRLIKKDTNKELHINGSYESYQNLPFMGLDDADKLYGTKIYDCSIFGRTYHFISYAHVFREVVRVLHVRHGKYFNKLAKDGIMFEDILLISNSVPNLDKYYYIEGANTYLYKVSSIKDIFRVIKFLEELFEDSTNLSLRAYVYDSSLPYEKVTQKYFRHLDFEHVNSILFYINFNNERSCVIGDRKPFLKDLLQIKKYYYYDVSHVSLIFEELFNVREKIYNEFDFDYKGVQVAIIYNGEKIIIRSEDDKDANNLIGYLDYYKSCCIAHEIY